MFLAAAGIAVAACIAFAEPEAAKPLVKWLKKPDVEGDVQNVREARAAGEKANPQLWRALPKRNTGVFLASVPSEGAFAKAGMKKGDLVTEIESKPVTGKADFLETLLAVPIGEKVDLTLFRVEGGKLKKETVLFESEQSLTDLRAELEARTKALDAKIDEIRAEREKLKEECEKNPSIDKPDAPAVKVFLRRIEEIEAINHFRQIFMALKGLGKPEELIELPIFDKFYQPTPGVIGIPFKARLLQVLDDGGLVEFNDQTFMVYMSFKGKADDSEYIFKEPLQIGPTISYETAGGAKRTVYTAKPIDVKKLFAK